MSPVLIAVAVVLAIGLWGFLFSSKGLSMSSGSTTGGLSASQIAGYASNAGFSGSDLVTAVAIALAESSGNPGAIGKLGEIGLWQIYPTAHPEFDVNQLPDPQYNANAAFALYSRAGGAFHDWSTYTQGTYTAYLSTAAAGVSA